MNPLKLRKILIATVLAFALAVAGCTTSSTESAAADTDMIATTETTTGSDDATTATETTTSSSEETEAASAENQESHASADDLEYDESSVVEISLNGDSVSSDSADVTVEGSTVTITSEGVYSLSGTLADGEVVIDAADEADVILLLEGVDITNADGATIAAMNADEVVIILQDGSTNRLTDGDVYSFPDAETDEPNATLYSAADLTIAGDGELIVDANYNDGITSKDGLVIESGTITIEAVDDGIRGKDYVIINGGTIEVDAGGDAIKADNDEDIERGYIMIVDGEIDLTAGDDGVQAATDVIITGGSISIDAGSDSDTGRAIQGDVMVLVSGGVIDATAVDDAIHSNNEITIDGGELTLASGDDGIHGDFFVTVNGGSITITESFEGIESEVIEINDGFIDVTSSDDGLNVADGAATATTAETTARAPGGGGPGGGGGAAGEYYVYINGGTTVITVTGDLDEQGDGIDSNGYVVMTGGTVVINGSTDTRNSALDYNGEFEMTGGLLIGTNINGRNSQGVGSDAQASLYVTSDAVLDAGTVVHIQTADGTTLVTFEPTNEYNVIVFSSEDLVDGTDYEIYLGGSVSGDSSTGLYEDSAYTVGKLAGTATAAS